MKVGILTFHFASNYGAVIQAWALQAFLRAKGHDAIIINYDPRCRRFPWFVHALKRNIYVFVRELKFRLFRKRNLVETRSILAHDAIDNLGCDAYIVGSDQVWNIDFWGFDHHYFLDFVPKGVKKIAYAASIGEGCWDPRRKELVSLLKDFTHISVRENFAKDIVAKFSEVNVKVVPDPTLLVSVDNYKRLMWPVPTKGNRFRVFIYGLNGINRCMKILDKVLQVKPNSEVRIVKLSDCPIVRPKGRIKMLNPSPIEWLREIFLADLIITDSFHGVALSIKFGKPFYTFYKQEEPNTSDRIRTLLGCLGITSRALDLKILNDSRARINIENVSYCSSVVDAYVSDGTMFLEEALR